MDRYQGRHADRLSQNLVDPMAKMPRGDYVVQNLHNQRINGDHFNYRTKHHKMGSARY